MEVVYPTLPIYTYYKSGSYVKVNMNIENNWNFIIYNTKSKPFLVLNLIDKYRNENKLKFKEIISWNGGYILNAELIGKMGLPEKYIGSPLGLLMINKEIFSSPLFNKLAILIYDNKNYQEDVYSLPPESRFVSNIILGWKK